MKDNNMGRTVRNLWPAIAMVVLTFAWFAPAIRYEFVGFDDSPYVEANPMVRNGFSAEAMRWAWTTHHMGYWAPLLWTSYQADAAAWGPEPRGFHLTNVMLHALNAGLLFWLLRRWTQSAGLAVVLALLWALHPLRVESVAWIAERKGVLSGFFFLLCLLFYTGGGETRGWKYAAGVACLTCAMWTKPGTSITTPFVLMLLDVWPLRRFDWSWQGALRLAREKWAFWISALGFGCIAWNITRSVQYVRADVPPLGGRLLLIPGNYLAYLRQTIWPVDLSIFYPTPTFRTGIFVVAAAGLVASGFSGFAGGLYQRPDVTLVVAEGRGYLQSHERQYDVIQVPLFGSFTAAASGVHALNESYLYTVEAFGLFYRRLTPGGVFVVTSWLKSPPRDAIKVFATAVEALRREGVAEPGKHLVMIRSLNSATLVVSKAPLSADDVAAVRVFCQARSFDPCHFPGILEEETNRYVVLSEGAVYYSAAQALVSDHAEDFYRDYLFYVRPATDARPYFFRFFKWTSLPRLVRGMGAAWAPFVEWGYVALIATMLQAGVASVVFILAPLLALGRAPAARGLKRWVVLYFALLGLGYMFLEIVFMQRFMLFLAYPVYSVAVVLTSFLFFSGLGSCAAGRLAARSARNVAVAVAGLAAVATVYLAVLGPVFEALAGLPDAAKIALSVAGLAPLAFCMGIPFPLGLQAAANRSDALLPWAWGINGCASVLGATLATAGSVHLGFPAVVMMALVCYGLAALALRPMVRRERPGFGAGANAAVS